ncbi:hypothetical protein ACOMHN_003299 [Nucella lapillus]
MDTFTANLPPVPGCFSKLLLNESETSAFPGQPWSDVEKVSELRHIILKSFALDSVPDTPLVMEGEMNESGTSDTTVIEVSMEDSSSSQHSRETDSGCAECEDQPRDLDDQYPESENSSKEIVNVTLCEANASSEPTCSSRLNEALAKLKQEMVDLRHLDMSLFCQLLSLNEAIQDYKTSICDRCSEYTGSEHTCSEYTGSEYSYGGSMGSRVESFSSLNEELGGENKNNSGDFEDGGESGDDLAESTSSLLKEIRALTKRAEDDF